MLARRQWCIPNFDTVEDDETLFDEVPTRLTVPEFNYLKYEQGMPAARRWYVTRANMCNPEFVKRFIAPRDLSDMWEKQRPYLDFVRKREGPDEEVFGGMLCPYMRSGKTRVLVERVFEDIQERVRADPNTRMGYPTLVVCQIAQLSHWEGEFAKWLREEQTLSVGILNTTTRSVERFLSTCLAYDVIITTYSTLRSIYHRKDAASHPLNVLMRMKYRRVICDEAHHFLNDSTQLSKAMHALKADIRWFVTGTPLQSRGMDDLRCALEFLGVSNPGNTLSKLRPYLKKYMLLGDRELDSNIITGMRRLNSLILTL